MCVNSSAADQLNTIKQLYIDSLSPVYHHNKLTFRTASTWQRHFGQKTQWGTWDTIRNSLNDAVFKYCWDVNGSCPQPKGASFRTWYHQKLEQLGQNRYRAEYPSMQRGRHPVWCTPRWYPLSRNVSAELQQRQHVHVSTECPALLWSRRHAVCAVHLLVYHRGAL